MIYITPFKHSYSTLVSLNIERWMLHYRTIVSELNIDPEKDSMAARLLGELIKDLDSNRWYKQINETLHGSACFVFGAGPSLPIDVALFKKLQLHKRPVVVSADGATSCLFEQGIRPDIIVTDLDGEMQDIQQCHKYGSYLSVHAHGDNMQLLETYVPKFKERIIGTTQVEPGYGLWNFGGFTDGDRAVLLCEELECDSVFLLGMDLGKMVGRFSKSNLKEDVYAWPSKLIKLGIAKRILEDFAKYSKAKLYNATSKGEDINGFIRVAGSELNKLV